MPRPVVKGKNDVASQHPELLSEWAFDLNHGLSPDGVASSSPRRIWWRCVLGHEWEAPARNRWGMKAGCPVCGGKRALAGFNDLATVNPNLAAEWHSTRNGSLHPTEVTAGSDRVATWLCAVGHEWDASISSRGQGIGCPYCSGRRAIPGLTDLATRHPQILGQWHSVKNEGLDPRTVAAASNRKVWWACGLGHEWEATPAKRTVQKRGCPVCSNQRVLAGYNDLASTFPHLVDVWDPVLNLPLTPDLVIAGTGRKLWWRCQREHCYQSRPHELLKGRGCPVCANKQVVAGVNDLLTTSPDLAADWHPTLNFPDTPRTVAEGAAKRVWWRCSLGHEWRAALYARLAGSGCPVCAGQRVLPGFNDLATTNPLLALQWHPTRNEGATPDQVMAGSGAKRWWLCSRKHEWQATMTSRNKGHGCPYCPGRRGGFDTGKPGRLYLLASPELQARKVGIANVGSDRLKQYSSDWQVLEVLTHPNGLAILRAEMAVLAWVRDELGIGPYLSKVEMGAAGGWSETFSGDGPSDLQVIQRMAHELLTATRAVTSQE